MAAPPEYFNADGVPNERSSDKAAYALSLQKACDTALERVKNNNVVAHSKWATSLALAPSAISTMAILFKVADSKCAAGLEVESQEVMNLKGNDVIGALPSKYFHTNLQHCSDLGRLAFQDAQHSMSAITATARSLISENGSIATVIELLEDPEEARYELKPTIEALKKSAKKCLDGAQAIAARFHYWHLVIIHLKQTSLTKKAEVIKQKDATATEIESAKLGESMLQRHEAAVQDEMRTLQGRLAQAERDVDRAQEDLSHWQHQPLVLEPSALEEIERVRKLTSHMAAPVKNRGKLNAMVDYMLGQSEEHIEEDRTMQRDHDARVQKIQNEHMERARKQRDYQRQLAAERLAAAQQHEQATKASLAQIYHELAANNYQLAQAKSNLERTKSDLALLGNKEVELADIMKILDNSTKQLGYLKDQVEPMVDFFQDILTGINHTVDEDLEAFLRPITSNIVDGATPDEVSAINLRQKSKKRMLENALQMQGRFSAIADISSAYVTISADYIRPAIREMEELSALPESEWVIRSKEFSEKCNQSISDINTLVQKTSKDAEINMRSHIGALQKRAIAAAEENEE